MPLPGGLPGIVPYGADQTIYIVVDGCAPSGGGGQETQVECKDIEAVINEFMAGQFGDPIRVLAFNTLEHWSQDLSSDVAREIQARCDIEGIPVPDHVQDFLDRYAQAVAPRQR
jgi:hypothetical protein